MSKDSDSSQIAAAFQKHPYYPEFLQVQKKLAEKGHVCWVAGGAVRDLLLGRPVADFDLVTDATTEQILEIFPKALTVGASFGVVKLALKDKNVFFDLATFRRESDYVDGRRPSKVDYATPEEDAGRRDFTINALFWNDEKKQVVDFVSGLDDIKNQRLVCVGDAEVRFQEDHLRILRLLRFAIQLNFSCEALTLQAALARVPLLEKISGERIWAELRKMISFVKWSTFFQQPLGLSIFQFLFKSINLKKDFKKIDAVSGFDLLKFFFVVMDFANPAVVKQILKIRLKLGSDDLKFFDALVFVLDNSEKLSFAEWAFEVEKNELILQSLIFLQAIELFDAKLLQQIKKVEQSWPKKLIDGNDLLGFIEKEKIGDVLKKVRLLQFEQPDLDKSKILSKFLK